MTTQHPDPSSVPAADSDDWLGYSAYADALWSRVVRALDKDKGGKPLGDDPLVVGIFGEWGAGKSHLLKLMYRRAEAQSNLDIARRVLHAADDLTVPLTVLRLTAGTGTLSVMSVKVFPVNVTAACTPVPVLPDAARTPVPGEPVWAMPVNLLFVKFKVAEFVALISEVT